MSYDPRRAGCLCDICPLKGNRVVPPEGNANAVMAFVGETPGFQEERQGRPFVGPSGQQLEKLLWHVGLKRDQIWITNTVLCRPDTPGIEGKKRYDFPTYLAWVRMENGRRRKAALEALKAQGIKRPKNEPLRYEPVASPIDCCSVRLGAELAVLEERALQRGQPNGAVVVPLGNFALEAITGRKGIMKYRGSVLAATHHPNPDLELDKRSDR